MLKRSLDILLSLFGMLLTLPFLPLVALLIKLDSKGAVFYLGDRVGKDWRVFKMYKLRTMYETPLAVGASVSPAGDPRVTPLGRFLRRTKLNEVPQLLNVLKGEMTLVGPRPETPDLAALYPPYAKEIFTVQPGLVGPNQILGRNEEEWYPPGVDPQQYYLETILPKKLPIDLEYVRHASISTDLRYLAAGLWETLFKALDWKFMLQNRSQVALLGTDLLLSLCAMTLAHLLRFEGFPAGQDAENFLQALPLTALVRLPCFAFFGLYGTLIRYLSYADILNVCKGVCTGSLFLAGWLIFVAALPFSRAVLLIDCLLLTFLMAAVRFALRLSWDWQARTRQLQRRRRVLIYGAGHTGTLAFRFLIAHTEPAYDVIGFLDDDPAKRYKTLHGKKVLGNRFTLEAVVKLYQIQEIFLAIPHALESDLRKITRACDHAGVRYRVFPVPHNIGTAADVAGRSPDTLVAPLLRTPTIPLNQPAVRTVLQGKCVLLAGVCDALGQELCRQILHFSPQRLVVVEQYESYLSERVAHFRQVFPDACIVPCLCPPTGHETLAQVFLEYRPHVVFHNAMCKFVPVFPSQGDSIARINSLFTFALAEQAARAGCEYFTLISSEAAANRGHLIADSLRAAEIGLEQFFAGGQTSLITVRLCDILEEPGGIIARLREQIINREPIILSRHAKYAFLSKLDAAHVILDCLAQTASGAITQGIFVCKPGPATPLYDIASALAMLEGVQLGTDIPLQFADRVMSDGDAAAEEQGRLETTSNHYISLLHPPPFANAPMLTRVLQTLLHIEEQKLQHSAWEQFTRTLLGRVHPAES